MLWWPLKRRVANTWPNQFQISPIETQCTIQIMHNASTWFMILVASHSEIRAANLTNSIMISVNRVCEHIAKGYGTRDHLNNSSKHAKWIHVPYSWMQWYFHWPMAQEVCQQQQNSHHYPNGCKQIHSQHYHTHADGRLWTLNYS